MSELLPCPECGREPRVKRWSCDDGDVSIFCCGVTVDNGSKQWNRYVAAIELALAAVWQDECQEVREWIVDIDTSAGTLMSAAKTEVAARDHAFAAFMRVLEVFR